MIINNLSLSQVRIGDVPAPITADPLLEYLSKDSEGYYIIGSHAYGARVFLPDELWALLKSKIEIGIKVTYSNNTVANIPLSQWKTANVTNYDNITTVQTRNAIQKGCFLLHDEISGNDITGSDYSAITIFNDLSASPSTWNWSTRRYGLRPVTNGTVVVSVK